MEVESLKDGASPSSQKLRVDERVELVKQIDPRCRRTSQLLHEALVHLTTEMGFDQVTVGDISKFATVNRSTFYRHYQDKFHCLRDIIRKSCDPLFEEMVGRMKHESMQDEIVILGFARILDEIVLHKKLYLALLGKKGSPRFEAWLLHYWAEKIETLMYSANCREGMRVTSLMASHAFGGSIVWWLNGDHRVPSEEMAAIFCDFLLHGIRNGNGDD